MPAALLLPRAFCCAQAKARSHLGQDVTVFERIFDGLQTISKGDIIRLSTKPAILGRVSPLERVPQQAGPHAWPHRFASACDEKGIAAAADMCCALQVEHFSIPQVVLSEGCYSGGRVTVCALPMELLGAENLHTWPLRRLEGKVSQAELAAHVSKELSKVGTASAWWYGCRPPACSSLLRCRLRVGKRS